MLYESCCGNYPQVEQVPTVMQNIAEPMEVELIHTEGHVRSDVRSLAGVRNCVMRVGLVTGEKISSDSSSVIGEDEVSRKRQVMSPGHVVRVAIVCCIMLTIVCIVRIRASLAQQLHAIFAAQVLNRGIMVLLGTGNWSVPSLHRSRSVREDCAEIPIAGGTVRKSICKRRTIGLILWQNTVHGSYQLEIGCQALGS